MGWPKFNQLQMVTTFTYKPSLVRIDARNFELSWFVVTDPPTITHPATHSAINKQTGPITIHCAAASAQCKYTIYMIQYLAVMALDFVCSNIILILFAHLTLLICDKSCRVQCGQCITELHQVQYFSNFCCLT